MLTGLLGLSGKGGTVAGSLFNPSYSNTGGTGDRRSIITVTFSGVMASGVISNIIDGSFANGTWWTAGQTNVNLTFYFLGASVLINAFKWYQSADAFHGGSNQFQGSDDNSSWTTLNPTGGGTTFVLSAPSSGREFTFVNTTPYKYYRITIPGATSASPDEEEIEFKIDGL